MAKIVDIDPRCADGVPATGTVTAKIKGGKTPHPRDLQRPGGVQAAEVNEARQAEVTVAYLGSNLATAQTRRWSSRSR